MTPITKLAGIGLKRAEAFGKLGLSTCEDLAYHFPRAYQHRGNVKLLTEAADGEVCSLLLTIGTAPKTSLLKRHMNVTKFTAFDESHKCSITFFNQEYIKDIFLVGTIYRFWGKLNKKGEFFDLTSPIFEAYTEGIPLPEFVPLYPLTEGISQKLMSNTIISAVEILRNKPDILPAVIREKYKLCEFYFGLQAIHRPMNYEMINIGRSRFVFEELFLLSLGISLTKTRLKTNTAPRMTVSKYNLEDLISKLPFKLTNAQSKAIDEISLDMCNTECVPMSRLVSGDVGSGKTICAAAAAFISASNGFQTALMAPTEILAQQHYRDLKPLFESLNINTALLTGSLKVSDKAKIKSKLMNAEIDFVIGTHALLTSDVKFKNLGLVITDEQHRFGVIQRSALAEHGNTPHVLVMSATPIPRTLALILYGDLNVSVIDELPPGRQKVDTFIVNETYRKRLNNFIRKQVNAGYQVYIVCPSVESNETDEGDIVTFDYGYDAEAVTNIKLKSAVDYANELQSSIFPEYKIAFIHGKLKGTEKEKIMRDFADGKINILVSTTVIEVGVNVPNASLMIVENAERFGLSQLHQLRGRVGRGSSKSYCILVSDSKSETALKRLEVMKNTGDGYKIAEKDLELRGPGDFFPTENGETRQHGSFKFKLANLCNDMELLTNAFQAAKYIAELDPNLNLPENIPLREALYDLFLLNENTFN